MSIAIENPGRILAPELTIRQLTASDNDRWDRFVINSPQATFFHRAGWRKVIEEAFRHKTYFFYAERDGDIHGILPLVHVRSFLFGNSLISTPFCAYGGVVATDEEVYTALENAACTLADELMVDYLELRDLAVRQNDWPRKSLYVTFRKPIDSDSEKNFLSIPRKQRAIVRKGIAADLHAEVDQTIDRLYAAYSESVRNLGTPVFSKKYFQILKTVFGSDCEVLTVTHDGRLLSSVMSFYFRDEVLPYYGGGVAASRLLKGNDFMYWELMKRCSEKGVRVFDYGRSKVGTGSYRFKKHWGFEPEPLNYRYHLVKAKQVPNISPTNPKYRLFIEAWKRIPLGVSRILGPVLARNLG